MNTGRLSQQVTLGFPALRALAAFSSLGAAAIHMAVAPEHFEEWGVYGWFFLGLASLQGLYALGLMVPRGRLFTTPWYLITGVALNLWVVGFYLITRTVGIPFGPHAGHAEEIGTLDVLSNTLELGTVASLGALLFWRMESRDVLVSRLRRAGIVLLGVAATLVLLGVLAQVQGEEGAIDLTGSASEAGEASAANAASPTLPTVNQLFTALVRPGYGPQGTEMEALYAPPIYFQASSAEVPTASLERPTFIFSLSEMSPMHGGDLPPQPPRTVLRLDGGAPIQPYQATVLHGASDHRESQLLFPMPKGMSQESLSKGEHTLALAMLLESGGESVLTWKLPLGLPGEAVSLSNAEVASRLEVSGLTQRLTRTQDGVQYEGRKGIRLEATYATSDYFAAALPKDAAARYLPDRFTAFLLTEQLHTAELPDSPPDVVMSLDGQTYKPDLVEEVTTSPHHRITLVRFPTEPPSGLRHHVMELALPGEAVMTWHFPISYAGLGSSSGLGVTWGWLLAVLGGLIAAMWPCLFQLTVFFIPALGGLNIHEASSSVSVQRRASVVKAALFFVLGFTVVYTIAGAVIGFAAGRLGDLSTFYTWQRYLGIAGGVVIVLLALRVAAKVRAPLVCKMPVLSGMGQRRRQANPLEMMVAGVAFATGCMTCFGAAIVVAMVVYVGLSGSALIGAFTLLLFSLGMGIPLVLAAIAMSKVLPLLSRFEKAIRWMGLASSLVMVGFAVLLITGNYMALTEWIYRLL